MKKEVKVMGDCHEGVSKGYMVDDLLFYQSCYGGGITYRWMEPVPNCEGLWCSNLMAKDGSECLMAEEVELDWTNFDKIVKECKP